MMFCFVYYVVSGSVCLEYVDRIFLDCFGFMLDNTCKADIEGMTTELLFID